MHNDRSLVRGTEVRYEDLGSMAGWYPVALGESTGTVWWRDMGAQRFVQPFFHDSLVAQPPGERRLCQTPLDALATVHDTVAPTAFIFHVSRCGSTLLTQMLATLAQNIVMSEPPVLDAFFRLHHRSPRRSGGLATLRGLVAALGQRRSAQERHFFVKLDSWHTPWMALLRQAYPATPVVFMDRAPHEVLASHRRHRGPQMVPGLMDLSALQVSNAGLAPGDLDGYAARVLDAIRTAALASMDAVQPIVVHYSDLPQAVWTGLLPALSVTYAQHDMDRLQARAAYHSKHTLDVFTGDDQANSTS
ncbi:MAG: hypothetical protein AB7P37_22995 [Ramlibacter sp.]